MDSAIIEPLVICRMISLVCEHPDEILQHIPTLTGHPSATGKKAPSSQKKRPLVEKNLYE